MLIDIAYSIANLLKGQRQKNRNDYSNVCRTILFMDWIYDHEIERVLREDECCLWINYPKKEEIEGGRYKIYQEIDSNYPTDLHPETPYFGPVTYILTQKTDYTYTAEIKVNCELVSKHGAELSKIIQNAQKSINEYWLHYKMVSLDERIQIEVILTVEKGTNNPIIINVYPDNYNQGRLYENYTYGRWGNDNKINVRETLSFKRITDPNITYDKTGRFPHEFGHIMGLPHDINYPSVMYSQKLGQRCDPNMDAYWKYGGALAKPKASHFKHLKVWVEYIFREELENELSFNIVPE